MVEAEEASEVEEVAVEETEEAEEEVKIVALTLEESVMNRIPLGTRAKLTGFMQIMPSNASPLQPAP